MQVFVNFAKEQHDEEDLQAHDNPVDLSDEFPLKKVETVSAANEVSWLKPDDALFKAQQ